MLMLRCKPVIDIHAIDYDEIKIEFVFLSRICQSPLARSLSLLKVTVTEDCAIIPCICSIYGHRWSTVSLLNESARETEPGLFFRRMKIN